MRKYIIIFCTVLSMSGSLNYGQITPEEKGIQAITLNAIKAQLGFLASDWTEGRAAGEKGEYISSDYIASILQLYGVKPGGDLFPNKGSAVSTANDERSYFQNFVLLKTQPGEEQILKVKSTEGTAVKTTSFTYGIDYYARSSSDIEIEAPVVFVGYGFKNDKLKYNDLFKVDFKGKFILKINGSPAFAQNLLSSAELSASVSDFENQAKAGGALGIIEVYPKLNVIGVPSRKDFNNLSPAENNPRPPISNAVYSIPGKNIPDNLLKIIISIKAANEIIKGTGMGIDDYLKKADANTPFSMTSMNGKSIYLKSTIKTTSVAVRNVIGIIEGNNPDQVIVLGAHYDHLGMNNGIIWNGADDNGSGTVGVLTISKAIIETGIKPEKTIVFALWTAEEEGLLGSRYWVQNPTLPLKNIRLNVNFDMISRYISVEEPKKVTMTYTSSCAGFKDITVANLKKYNIDLVVDYQPSADPPGGTDHRSFVAAGIPIMRFKPGHREEYHTPQDEIGTINWDIMEKIIKISFTNIWDLANSNW